MKSNVGIIDEYLSQLTLGELQETTKQLALVARSLREDKDYQVLVVKLAGEIKRRTNK
jgi:hypothetical protein